MKIDRDRFLLGMVLGGLLLIVVKISDFSAASNHTIGREDGGFVLAATSSASMSNDSTSTPTPVPLSGYCINVPVLLYHHVQPQSQGDELGQTTLSVDNIVFEEQIAYLVSRGFTTISTNQLADALLLKTPLPQNSIVITFDDGYADAYTYVYPIVQKYNVVINLAISTGLIGSYGYLTWEQIDEMSRSKHIYLVNHTWSHYPLDQGAVDKIKFEVETAKQQLEERTGQTVDILVYPYGSFDDEAINVLQEIGFRAAFSTIPGFWQCDSFIMTLHRNHIGNAPLSEYGL